MSSNFDFLQKIDNDLFEIILEAEKLYRDEYFEQCMAQTRRFAENLCKKVLGNKRTSEVTFDDMLATLKDNITGKIQEKEFIDDLYFLKKNGNSSVHSSKVKKDGIAALECLQRAFEAAIIFSVYNSRAPKNILKLRYDTELLITNISYKKSLTEKYAEKKAFTKEIKTSKPHKNKPVKFQSHQMTPKKKQSGISFFLVILGITTSISLGMIVTMLFMVNLK